MENEDIDKEVKICRMKIKKKGMRYGEGIYR